MTVERPFHPDARPARYDEPRLPAAPDLERA